MLSGRRFVKLPRVKALGSFTFLRGDPGIQNCAMWLSGKAKVVLHVGVDEPPALAKDAKKEEVLAPIAATHTLLVVNYRHARHDLWCLQLEVLRSE